MDSGKVVIWINLGVVLLIGLLQLLYTYVFSRKNKDNDRRDKEIAELRTDVAVNSTKIENLEKK